MCSLSDIYFCICFVGSKGSRSQKVGVGKGTHSMFGLCLQLASW